MIFFSLLSVTVILKLYCYMLDFFFFFYKMHCIVFFKLIMTNLNNIDVLEILPMFYENNELQFVICLVLFYSVCEVQDKQNKKTGHMWPMYSVFVCLRNVDILTICQNVSC